MKDKEKEQLWKAVEEYVASIKEMIPSGLLISHGFSIDDRKQWKKLKKKFKSRMKRSR